MANKKTKKQPTNNPDYPRWSTKEAKAKWQEDEKRRWANIKAPDRLPKERPRGRREIPRGILPPRKKKSEEEKKKEEESKKKGEGAGVGKGQEPKTQERPKPAPETSAPRRSDIPLNTPKQGSAPAKPVPKRQNPAPTLKYPAADPPDLPLAGEGSKEKQRGRSRSTRRNVKFAEEVDEALAEAQTSSEKSKGKERAEPLPARYRPRPKSPPQKLTPFGAQGGGVPPAGPPTLAPWAVNSTAFVSAPPPYEQQEDTSQSLILGQTLPEPQQPWGPLDEAPGQAGLPAD
ncbi:hypothetical protein M011DRAFT_473566 [Sporormia fimetaria CBS 119925]|uniref:Uncharacterized protein n=1 Tax=Sporormia fimetaria CBS 119925 TaxID=1340428 RepID=A0A6A6VSW3_9PLEO|nr:hypothetical protein M011DRAFT_473566 [Sporormia fimetaria CBS 119925]